MRNQSANRATAANFRITDERRPDEVSLLVCGALALALVALAGRIITMW